MIGTTPNAAEGNVANTLDPRTATPMQWAQKIAKDEFPLGQKNLHSLFHGCCAGVWRAFDDTALAGLVAFYLGEHAKPSLVKSVVQALHWLAVEVPDMAQSVHQIGFENGVVDDRTGELKGHNSAFNVRSVIPIPHDSKAECQRFLNFLGQLFKNDQDMEDKIKLLQEVFGLALSHRTCQKILALIGEEGSGVRLIAELLYHMVGEANTTVFGLNQFHSPDVCAAVEGKLLNLTVGFPSRRLHGDSKLGQIVGGNRIEVSPKGVQPYRFKPTVTVVVSDTSLPSTAGSDDGFMRQIVPLTFNGVLSAAQQDSFLEELISEMPGIINWALEGLRRFIEQGHLTEPASSKALLETYSEEADPFHLFVEECLRRSEDRTGLYGNEILHNYIAWAKENGHKIKESTITLGRKLASLGYESHKSGTTVWEVCWAEAGEQYGSDDAADNGEVDGDDQFDVAPQEQDSVHTLQELPRPQSVAGG